MINGVGGVTVTKLLQCEADSRPAAGGPPAYDVLLAVPEGPPSTLWVPPPALRNTSNSHPPHLLAFFGVKTYSAASSSAPDAPSATPATAASTTATSKSKKKSAAKGAKVAASGAAAVDDAAAAAAAGEAVDAVDDDAEDNIYVTVTVTSAVRFSQLVTHVAGATAGSADAMVRWLRDDPCPRGTSSSPASSSTPGGAGPRGRALRAKVAHDAMRAIESSIDAMFDAALSPGETVASTITAGRRLIEEGLTYESWQTIWAPRARGCLELQERLLMALLLDLLADARGVLPRCTFVSSTRQAHRHEGEDWARNPMAVAAAAPCVNPEVADLVDRVEFASAPFTSVLHLLSCVAPPDGFLKVLRLANDAFAVLCHLSAARLKSTPEVAALGLKNAVVAALARSAPVLNDVSLLGFELVAQCCGTAANFLAGLRYLGYDEKEPSMVEPMPRSLPSVLEWERELMGGNLRSWMQRWSAAKTAPAPATRLAAYRWFEPIAFLRYCVQSWRCLSLLNGFPGADGRGRLFPHSANPRTRHAASFLADIMFGTGIAPTALSPTIVASFFTSELTGLPRCFFYPWLCHGRTDDVPAIGGRHSMIGPRAAMLQHIAQNSWLGARHVSERKFLPPTS